MSFYTGKIIEHLMELGRFLQLPRLRSNEFQDGYTEGILQ